MAIHCPYCDLPSSRHPCDITDCSWRVCVPCTAVFDPITGRRTAPADYAKKQPVKPPPKLELP